MKKVFYFFSFCITFISSFSQDSVVKWEDLALPDTGKIWIQPARSKPALPVWGHAHGISVGLFPMPGPRGLLRVYTPYLGLDSGRMINFIAIEPIPAGTTRRGLSELEMSDLDNKRGKRFWSSNDSVCKVPANEIYPARGIVSEESGSQILTVFIFIETFQNGARVFLRLRFYENNPCEVEITTYACSDSKQLDYCIVTATMGNLTRLRTLYLKNYEILSTELWPDYTNNGFAPHVSFPVKDMISDKSGRAYFIAAPNETNLQDAIYSQDTYSHWKYEGNFATQYWISEKPSQQLEGLVNGRVVYWASNSPIPGGISFENFELKEPFRNGTSYIFGVTHYDPEFFIEKLNQ